MAFVQINLKGVCGVEIRQSGCLWWGVHTYYCCTHVLLLYKRITAIHTYSCYTYVLLLYIRITAIHTYSCCTYVLLLYIRIPAIHTYSCCTYILQLYIRITAVPTYYYYTFVSLLYIQITTCMHTNAHAYICIHFYPYKMVSCSGQQVEVHIHRHNKSLLVFI